MIRFNTIRCVLSAGLIALSTGLTLAQESVLSTGAWYKLAVAKRGVYKIDYGLLKKMGIDPSRINPQKIKLFGNTGGMLPQANSNARATDLTELAVTIIGEEDGRFNKEDYILFYAQGADRSYFDEKKEIFFYEKNLYDDQNYYFLTLSEKDGKRIEKREDAGNTFPLITSFDDFVYHELDKTNELKSGREWFGENFNLDPEQIFKINLSNVSENTPIKIVSDVMAQSYSGSSFRLFFNNISIGEQYIPSIFNSQYSLKGRHKRDTLFVNSTAVSPSNNAVQELKYQYLKSAGYSNAYLDYFLVSLKRELSLYGDQTIFLSSVSLQNSVSTYEITSGSETPTIWDITDPSNPIDQVYSFASGVARFGSPSSLLHEFIIFNNTIPLPKFVSVVANQNLHGQATPNLLIVAHPDFIEQAKRLAHHREAHNGLSVLVASTDEVFNEFSSGRKDLTAIRDFTKHLYDKDPSTLKSLLLFGRGSFDYKDRLVYNTNFVPTYESRNSLEPLETYSSDDYFGFLEASEGEWSEDPPEYHTLDIGVGRLPVTTLQEATNVVNKLIEYDTNKDRFGSWRKEIVFVADDGDGNTHQNQADKLALKVEAAYPEFNTQRIFLDSYKQELRSNGEFSPKTNEAIQQALDRGAVVVNYTGHGGEKVWAQEKIFDNTIIDKLDNKNYPLFVTATCEFGRNDNPLEISSAELSILKNNGGAIGMVTTARPVNSSTNFELNQAFYDALFTREGNGFLSLGEIFRRTKNNSMSGVSNRNFALLGDPSMKLAFPTQKIIINKIENEEGYDSLKALSTIIITGQVNTLSNDLMEDFDGTVEAILFDKKAPFTTLGNENPPYAYKQWYNIIFRGAASVIDGTFEIRFVVPKNIAYQTGQGKLSVYAYNNSTAVDGTGSTFDFIVGKSNLNPSSDTTPPTIKLFMADETFSDGGSVASDSYLVATLHDNSGINISGYGIGNSIIAILDDDQTFILNDYYQANKDDFTNGKIRYRLRDLSPGKHTLKIKAWDTHNNPAEAIITFNVLEEKGFKIENFGNYPNPFTQTTTLFFTHSRPGEDLEAFITIFDLAGHLVKSADFTISASNYKVELPEFDANLTLDKKLPPGLYLCKLVVRSVTDGSKNERVTKLIVLN